VALDRFLYACEASAAVPTSLKAPLADAHVGGRLVITVSKSDARAVADSIDALIPPPAAPGTSAAAAEAAAVADPLGRGQQLAQWLVQHWDALSIEAEDAVTDAMVRLGLGLDHAESEADAASAAQEFLAAIRASAPALVEAARTDTKRGADDRAKAGAAAENILKLRATLQRHPAVRQALEAGDRSAESAPPPPPPPTQGPASLGIPPTEAAAEDTGAAASTAAVPFHTFVDFPAEVTVFDERIPLVVQLTLEAQPDSLVDETVLVGFTAPAAVEQVLVVCDAQDFEHERGGNTRLIEVVQARDSQLAVFLLTPKKDVAPGAKRISLDFYHRSRLAGSAAFETVVKDRPPLPQPEKKASSLTLFGIEQRLLLESPVAEMPDFVLRITLGAGARRDAQRLSFTLDSPKGLLGYRHKPVGEITLADDPRRFLETKIIDLSMKARKSVRNRKPGETESFIQDIAKIGWDLFEQLFPSQLKEEWPKVQAAGAPGTLSLLLISDEPWIPWELVNTPDKDGKYHLDGFLCQQFRMARWLAGPGLPDQLGLDTMQLIAPTKTDLPSIKKEISYFASVGATTPAVRIAKDLIETADQVEQAMSEQRARVYHFSCHGEFEPGDPDSSGLILSGEPLKPSDIVGPTLKGIRANRPLIFLNACSSAEADFGLSRIGGWAERFVSAGATAFVGSLWEVNDVLAAEFAIAFYRQLLAGKPLGEAFYLARQVIKQQDAANPTWLAYVLYAHPNGAVTLGE
jgi:hypothetical protein